jgi:hypothetical protein
MLIENKTLVKPPGLPIGSRRRLKLMRSRTTERMRREAAVHRVRSFVEGAPASVVHMITEYFGDSQQELF